MPDLFIKVKAENGYNFIPQHYYPSVSPSAVNKTFYISPELQISNWETDGFWVYFYEVDLGGSSLETMDSVRIRPYVEGDSKRFKDTLDVSDGAYTFTANMQWVDDK